MLSVLKATRLGETPREDRLSRLTWVGILHYYFTPRLQRRTESVIPLLSHNITSNAKHFIQPPDAPHPLTLDWDDENLPEQIVQAGGFDAILYTSSHP